MKLNENAYELVEEAVKNKEKLKIEVRKSAEGPVLLDFGIKASGGEEAGVLFTKICMSGLADVELLTEKYGDRSLKTISVETKEPVLSCLASQLAGWNLRSEGYYALGSGPARILAKKPKKIFEKINYEEKSDIAVLAIEAKEYPPNELLLKIADKCGVNPNNLYVVMCSTTSIVGSIQVSGRVVESGLHKMLVLNYDVRKVRYGWGKAPIMPVSNDYWKMVGKTNDALVAAGQTRYIIDDSQEVLKELADKLPASTSKDYGKPFYELLKEVNFDFYKLDPNLFSIAEVEVESVSGGFRYRSGKVDLELLERSLAT